LLGITGATSATVLATALVPGLLDAPGQASTTVHQSYTVPANGVLHLTGHGYGHGHGMSQYGAQGAAEQGLTYRQILSFYYPGTTLGTVGGSMRVLISADTDHEVQVVPASGLSVRQVGGAAYTLPTTSGIKTWRLSVVSGKTTVSYDNGSWHAWRTLGGDGEFYRSGVVTLRVSGTTRNYRGSLRLTGGRTVDVVGLDDYVRGVAPREMPASWQPDAVRAQAVAARTYGAYERAANASRSYDICDTSACQVYGGAGAEDSRSNAAVTATAGQVLTYSGKPAFTQFASSDGGWTAAGGMPYLPAKADPYDGFSGNPVHTWTTTVTRSAIQKAWPSAGTVSRVVVTQRDGNGDWHGRVEKLVLAGSKKNVTVTGDSFRSRFGLRSSWFSFGTGSGGSTTSPTPSPSTGPPTPITQRWRAIGGYHSILGGPKSAEYAVAGGRARRFAHGRLYWSPSTGAHELYRRVLRTYLRHGGAPGKLGFPLTSPHKVGRRVVASFQHGTLSAPRKGRVKVTWS
jgi:SpoIID/LytB domain protein